MTLFQGEGCRSTEQSTEAFFVQGNYLFHRSADGFGANPILPGHKADISSGVKAYIVKPGQAIVSGCQGYAELFSVGDPRAQNDGEEVLRCLIGEGTDPRGTGLAEGRLLEMAYRSGDAQLLQDLVAGGLDVDSVGDDGETVLQQAIRARDPAAVGLLVEAGADVNGTGANGETALRRAIRIGDTDVVRLLLDAGADIKRTPSLVTGAIGNPELLRLLIKEGADVNYRNPAGDSVLHEAILYGDAESVTVLLESGAVLESHDEPIDSLLELATYSSTPEMAGLFITLGGDVNSRGIRGSPMLFTAIESSYPEMVRLFLEAGADPNAIDGLGDTALVAAAEEANPEAVRLLLEAGVDPNAMTVYSGTYNDYELNIYGSSPLLSAIMIPGSIGYDDQEIAEDEVNRVPTIQILLDAGVDPWADNGSDYSICGILADYRSIERNTGALITLRVQEVLLDHCREFRDKQD